MIAAAEPMGHLQHGGQQVRELCTRQAIRSLDEGTRRSDYFGERLSVARSGLTDALPADKERPMRQADTPTWSKRLDRAAQTALVDWGYATYDNIVRRNYDPAPSPACRYSFSPEAGA